MSGDKRCFRFTVRAGEFRRHISFTSSRDSRCGTNRLAAERTSTTWRFRRGTKNLRNGRWIFDVPVRVNTENKRGGSLESSGRPEIQTRPVPPLAALCEARPSAVISQGSQIEYKSTYVSIAGDSRHAGNA